jgi:hypothetical protein
MIFDMLLFVSQKKSAMKKILFLMVAFTLITSILAAQETRREKRKTREKAKMEEVKQMFDQRTLQFLAQSAHPMSGGVFHLTSTYTLTIKDKELTSYLPYYGVAYRADYPAGDGGIMFTEKAMASDWKSTRNGFEVKQQVKTVKDIYLIYLQFSESGYGSLQVTCNNRQPIRFSGIVQAVPGDKK